MSTFSGSRYRSVSATSTDGPQDEEVKQLLDSLSDLDDRSFATLKAALHASGILQRLRHRLLDTGNTREAKGAFRRARGYHVLLEFLTSFCAFFCEPDFPEDQSKAFLSILQDTLILLSTSLQEHTGNQKYFATRAHDGGWRYLQTILGNVKTKLLERALDVQYVDQFFGILFAVSLNEEMLSDLFAKIRRVSKAPLNGTASPDVSPPRPSLLQSSIKSCLQGEHQVANADLIPILLLFWSEYITAIAPMGLNPDECLQISVPSALLEILSASRSNLVAAHTAGLLTHSLAILSHSNLSESAEQSVQALALKLCEEGVSHLSDAECLFNRAISNSKNACFLLKAIRTSRTPPRIQFDVSRQGFSCAELATLTKSFPPLDTGGYTLAVWARFDSFDANAHTTIFGAFDKSQTCFLLVYLEKDSQNLILQTAIKGSRPSVRFKSTTFEIGCWYHICIVHKRSRNISSSRASLFVNGEFIEQQKSSYPTSAPVDAASKRVKIQAFWGTPRDLAPTLSEGACLSKWSLGSSVLFSETFSDDIVAVFYHMGPGYHGNFQDCLGSFQTYGASAALNLRNENLHLGKEEQSDIISAIRHKASTLIPESAILFNISPLAVLDDDDRNNINESQLVKSLSKRAAKNLQQYTKHGGNAIAINGAVPAINDALTQAHGTIVLVGDPVISTPQSLDNVCWQLSGCVPIVLTLVHRAQSRVSLALAVEILLEVVQHSWRNSEAMEKEHGFAILAALLHDKLNSQREPANSGSKLSVATRIPMADIPGSTLETLQLILKFVGYDGNEPQKSTIINPLAYRVLLLDTDIWRSADHSVQELYFSQFATFAVISQFHRFNTKRLVKMRALKKLLEALKSEVVTNENVSLYILGFKALLPAAMSPDVLRALALFITYSVHKGKLSLSSKKMARINGKQRLSTGSGSDVSDTESESLPRFQVGVEVLKLYAEILCAKDDTSSIKKFAKTVTNKWLLYLMSEGSPEIVVLSTKILARLLVEHGRPYVQKFKDKSGGFIIMRHRLKRWWHLPALWPTCFAILFGADVASLDLERPFDLFGLLDMFMSANDVKLVCPEMLEVIFGMLQNGLRTIVNSKAEESSKTLSPETANTTLKSRQRLSMSTISPPDPLLTIVADHHVETLNVVIRFLADVQSRSQNFRDFTVSSSYIQDLLFVLFPVVVGSDTVGADIELNARDSTLTFDGQDVVVQPLSKEPPVIRTVHVDEPSTPKWGQHLRRGSSFVFVASQSAQRNPPLALSQESLKMPSNASTLQPNDGHAIVQSLLEIVITCFSEQILLRKDFSGLGLFLKTPPGFIEHQTYFESWVLRNTLSQLQSTILLDQRLLQEPRVLTNLARLFSHTGEALYEGWFVGGAVPALDFAGSVLEYLQRPDVAKTKSVRLCSQSVAVIRSIVFRVVLLALSQVQGSESLTFLRRLAYWQTVLLASEETQSDHLQLICYLLYGSLISDHTDVRMEAANLWRIILVQKPDETFAMFDRVTTSNHVQLAKSFEKLLELDNETFLIWVDDHRNDLDSIFFEDLSKPWESFVSEENKRTRESVHQRLAKRRDRLRQWHHDETEREEIIRRHEITFDHWTSNIHASEHMKYQRTLQDLQDSQIFTKARFELVDRDVRGPTGIWIEQKRQTWRLDQTEGRNRMRLRLKPETESVQNPYQPRKRASEAPPLRLETRIPRVSNMDAVGLTPTISTPQQAEANTEPFPDLLGDDPSASSTGIDESFEIVDDPTEGLDEYEDKNRKVMRNLLRGDQVKHVSNISRLVGLEAVEGLLILGKDNLYLIDKYFQRADGEIVDVWQAPPEERDPYVRMISGRETLERGTAATNNEHKSRNWKWVDIISVSKRRFLFRDVGLELFFADGRSYLLTVSSPSVRNELHAAISAKAPQHSATLKSHEPENYWRYESLRSPDDEPKGLGSKVANVFGQAPSNIATRKWQKGEISNFQYLMLVNTMAGRTYNDLTQYPVFPWIVADYTSEELDLSDPKTFRDLSKPMGCQTLEREAEFRERYKSFAEMADHNSPAFHYGTHYSSAMIVTSYLVRLQPFVKSYLLLQGGAFDHADRMFYSIEKAWNSSSQLNMTDVRELIPEFFSLPEFLVNLNGFDFGQRQSSAKSIDSVELPPWAKGDPKIFITKHREALESPYVSQNLHKWIDLVFGFKQRGEAALEATNVFHHLSYQGAKDLDSISDPVERLATIGIIHNFGQTPFQVFQKSHPAREEIRHKYKRLDTAVESLTKVPSHLLDSGERVASLLFSWKQERLLCSAAFRLNIPPSYDKYMEWGFADNSVRFYSADSRKLTGHFEHLHVGQLSSAAFADSRTLVTAGVDGVIAVWNVVSSGKTVDLQPKSCLFGHRAPVTVLTISRSFNALLSASADGSVFLWDLNRLEFVRKVDKGSSVDCACSNDITGEFIICRGARISIYSINAELLLEQDAGDGPTGIILSCVCYEGAGSEWLERGILFTGHKNGVVKVWSKVVRGGRFELELIRQLNHVDGNREDGTNVAAGISCILPMPQVVYTGDEDGKVYEWDCVQRH